MGHDHQGGCCGGSKGAAHEHKEGGCCQGESKSAGGCCGGSGKAKTGCCGGASRAAMSPMTVEEIEGLDIIPLVTRFRRGIEHIDRRVLSLSERQIDAAFLPDAGVGRWPVRVLVGHIADADLAAIHRMRRIVAEDNPVFSEWDENAFVDANLYGDRHEAYSEDPDADHARVMQVLGGHLAVLHTLRQWTGQWLLSLEPSAFDRTGLHPTRGRMSLRTIVALYTWHLEHHARFLTLKLDRMLGPAPAEEPVATATGGCGCAH